MYACLCVCVCVCVCTHIAKCFLVGGGRNKNFSLGQANVNSFSSGIFEESEAGGHVFIFMNIIKYAMNLIN